MQGNSSDGDDAKHKDTPEPQPKDVAAEGLSVTDYLRLAEECLLLASLAKDPEEVAELLKTSDDYLRRAAEWLADQLKNH